MLSLVLSLLTVTELETQLLQNNRYRRVVAFRPTGWSFKDSAASAVPVPSQNKSRSVAVYGVPYRCVHLRI